MTVNNQNTEEGVVTTASDSTLRTTSSASGSALGNLFVEQTKPSNGGVTVLPPDDPNDPTSPSKWKHRRRMAYIALISMIVVTAACFWVAIDRLEKLEYVITWFFMAMSAITCAYMGFATAVQWIGKR